MITLLSHILPIALGFIAKLTALKQKIISRDKS